MKYFLSAVMGWDCHSDGCRCTAVKAYGGKTIQTFPSERFVSKGLMCGFLSRIRVSHYYFSHWHAYLIRRSSSSPHSAPLSCGTQPKLFSFPPRSPEDTCLSFPPKHSAQPITERNDERFRVHLTVPPTRFSTKSKWMEGAGAMCWAGGVKRSLSCSLALTCCLGADLRVSHVFLMIHDSELIWSLHVLYNDMS